MIEIKIKIEGEHITDLIKCQKTTLLENALVIKRLLEAINHLQKIEYKNQLEVIK